MPLTFYTPDAMTARARDGASARDVFFDAAGTRVGKAIGLAASVAISYVPPQIESRDAAGKQVRDAAMPQQRAVDFTISTGALDRYNSTIRPEGWQLDNYAKNSVVLWAHDDSIPAIGRAENTRLENGILKSRAVFADAETHPLADTIFRLIKAGFIGAASVGWVPLEWKYVDGGDRGLGVDYLAQELLEWSVVNIPANPECLTAARSFGIDTRPLFDWAEHALDTIPAVLPRPEIEAIRKAAAIPVNRRKITRAETRTKPSDWKVGAARDLPIADADTWDASAAAARIFAACGFDGDNPDSEKARRGFLLYDAANPGLKASYKLPFADIINGTMKASAAGIRADAASQPQTGIDHYIRQCALGVINHYRAKIGEDRSARLRRIARAIMALDLVPAPLAGIVNTLRGDTQGEEAIAALIGAAIDLDAMSPAPLARAGKAISAKNGRKLQAAHDHCMAACDHLKNVMASNNPDDDNPDDDGDDDEHDIGDDTDDDRAMREQRVRVLKLKAGS